MNIEDALLPELRTRWDGQMLHHPLIVTWVVDCEDARRCNA